MKKRTSKGTIGFRPLHDRVLLERIEEAESEVGGIIIPDTAKEKPQRGRVLAVGKGRATDDGTLRALDVAVGDTVLFGKYAGTEIRLNGTEYLIVKEDEVLAVVDKGRATTAA